MAPSDITTLKQALDEWNNLFTRDARVAEKIITAQAEIIRQLRAALEDCARPFEKRHLVKRELIGESSYRMTIARQTLEATKPEEWKI